MKPYRALGYLPIIRYLVRDLMIFRRQGLSWRFAWSAALGYWRFDRGI